tara:strand:- start:4 stop:489 length:486 start_codon:yes stop_codon:yes gene_type:complete
MDLSFKKKLSSQRKENTRFFNILNRLNHKTLDESIHSIHEEVFKNTNCLKCANCCKTTGPLFTDKDINRISKKLRIKPSDFTTRYLKIDDDKDYVLKSVPCTFLSDDNSCSIYEFRPKACREFPHTNRKRQYQLLKLTKKNLEICPAVFNIFERLKIDFNK